MSKVNKTIKFGGLDNQHTPTQVGVDDLVIAANVDMMDDDSIQRRGGYAASPLVGTALLSLWGSLDETYGYVLDGSVLNYLDANLTATVVGNVPLNEEISYVEINDLVVAVSASVTNYLKGSAFVVPVIQALIDGEHQFKRLMSDLGGGNCAEFLNGRLLVGTDKGINFSDFQAIGQHDNRNFFLPIPFPVTTLAAVDTGLWVGGAGRTAFLPGTKINEMEYIDHIDSGIISIALARRAEWKENERVAPIFAALMNDGVFLLGEDGSMTQISKDKYKPSISTGAASIIRNINGAKQFLTSFSYVGDRHNFEEKTITMDIEEG